MVTRDVSSLQERNVAKNLGGRVTPNSGATSFVKGDVILDDLLVECKTKMTDVPSFTVQREWLEKLDGERIAMGKTYGVLAISFDAGKHSYYVLTERAMQDFVDYIRRQEDD